MLRTRSLAAVILALVFSPHAGVGAEATATPPDTEASPAYMAWRENIERCSAMRLTYTRLEEYHCNAALGKKLASTLTLSRSGDSLERDQLQERFEETQQGKSPAASGREQPAAENAARDTKIQVHGKSGFFSYYEQSNTGSMWKWWDSRTIYPLQIALPPSLSRWTLAHVDNSGNVLTFALSDRHCCRYYLEPSKGFMPGRIEDISLEKDGSEFMGFYITIDEYQKTPRGAFLPQKSTFHMGRPVEGGAFKDLVTTAYEMTSYAENVEFTPEEFIFKFPAGARVQDHRAEPVPETSKD